MSPEALDPEVYDDDPVLEAVRSSFRSTDTVGTTNHPFFNLFREDPKIAIICGLTDFLFEVSRSSPRDVDTILHVARHAKADETLPTVYWTSGRPAATFGEVFNVDFRDKLRGPEIFAAINDGLKLSNVFEWQGKIGSTGVAGACLQLLGGYSGLPLYLRNPPGKALEALKGLSVSEEDEPLQMFTIATLEDPQRRDFNSEEILAETTLAGWKF
ncbi:hypothetical protein K443DRAFT_105299 [Laccaria amethystina LaAM-08-1]|uniref:Uncharacterized protein n=1 Tax=Laccaria amethystina LaAM-08-1 TaxID=1095629 RepID=A0A0C9X8D9_9AGAR|nr:hypothetical protein K443DRAFT_105299 [Laccaria amethystina LaAM-08-1]